MLGHFQEKSWVVRLAKGTIDNSIVKSPDCKNCKTTSTILRINYHNPNLVLYGCKDSNCKHRLLRLDLEHNLPH